MTESTLSVGTFWFLPEHPKYNTHCLKLRSVPITPILLGQGIPRRDKDETQDAHAAAMLMLFKPWSSDEASLLKASEVSWSDAYNDFLTKTSPAIIKIINNMQAVHECKDAAHDFAAACKARLTELKKKAVSKGISLDDTFDDPILNAAMEVETLRDLLPEDFNVDTLIPGNDASKIDVFDSIDAAEKGGLYHYIPPRLNQYSQFTGKVSYATEDDIAHGDLAMKAIL